MKRFIVFVFTLIIVTGFLNTRLPGQAPLKRNAFISFNTGCFLPTTEDFRTIYGDVIFINGLSMGLPFTNKHLFLYGKADYFKKEGTPIIHHISTENGVIVEYTTQEGSVTIKYFLFNLGLQYNIRLSDSYNLITNGGLTLIQSHEKSDNTENYESESDGIPGFFLGVGLERKFSAIPLSLFAECQYNQTFKILRDLNIDHSSVNCNLGLRYYFKQTKK